MKLMLKGSLWHILTPTGRTIGFATTRTLAWAKAEQYARTLL